MNEISSTEKPDNSKTQTEAPVRSSELLACVECGAPAELTESHNPQDPGTAVQCPHGCHIFIGPKAWCIREWNEDMGKQANIQTEGPAESGTLKHVKTHE